MWEGRVNPGQLDEFCAWARSEAWPQFVGAEGFLGGEVYRSDEQYHAVVITHWADDDTLAAGNTWFDLGAERFLAAEAHAWAFMPVPLD